MLKTGLGKGLGDLMQGEQVAGKELSTLKNGAPVLSRGMKTLVQSNSIEPADPSQQNRPLLPTWFYFAADILLLAYTVGITFDAVRPFDLGTVLFCAISVGSGGLLAIAGFLQSSNYDRS